MDAWDVKEGLKFVSKGKGEHLWRVASTRGKRAVLEQLAPFKGVMKNVKRVDVLGYIDHVVED